MKRNVDMNLNLPKKIFRRLKTFSDNNIARNALKFVGIIAAFVFIVKIFPAIAGTIICLMLIGGYYGVIALSARFCNINFKKILLNDFPRIFIVAAVSTGFIVMMISAQQTIYTGDQMETWEPTLSCEEIVFTKPIHAVKDLIHSINHADYNNFLPMLMALPMHLFGKSFLCYELYVWLMFGLPAIFFASATFKSFFEQIGVKIFPCSVLMAILMLIPALEVPILVGYANISILLPAAMIFALLLSLDREKIQLKPLILIALLCVLAVFQARTAAYLILGLFFGYTVYIISIGVIERTLLRDLIALVPKFAVIGLAGLILTLPLFFPFIKHALTYDIGTAYSAYQRGYDFFARISAHMWYLGYLPYIFAIAGAIVSFRNKKTFPLAAMLLTWAIASPIFICRVQLVDRQHYYTMILPFAFLIALLIDFALSKRKIVGSALIFLLTINFLQTFATTFNTRGFFTCPYVTPIRHDIDELKIFAANMNKLTVGTEKKIYSFTDSAIYNCHTLKKLYVPENREAMPNLMDTYEIDLRDGFPTHFFAADFIIVSNPIQIHLLEKDQQIVVKLASLIENPSPLSRHFKKIGEYTFNATGEDVKFSVYEKISPFEKSDIDFVEKAFVTLYPDKNALFKDRFEKFKAENFKD